MKMNIGTEARAREGLTGWGNRKVETLWLLKTGANDDAKTEYVVMGHHRKEDGTSAGWGTMFSSTSLVEARNYMRKNVQ